jgi:hypothetical protein
MKEKVEKADDERVMTLVSGGGDDFCAECAGEWNEAGERRKCQTAFQIKG